MHLPVPVLALLAALVVCAGCIEEPAADPSAPPTITADVALIAPETLALFMPLAVPGWHLLAPPSPAVITEDDTSLVSVSGSYLCDSGEDRSADLTIQDTGGRSAVLRRLVDRLQDATGNGTAPARRTLHGQPAFVLDNGSMVAAYIIVADRYVALIAVPGGTDADLETFAAALDLEALSRQR